MSDLRLPFWLLIDAEGGHPPSAFTTTGKLASFREAHRNASWRITFVADRQALILAIADIHQQGAAVVWVDPDAGTAPGDSIQLMDLVELSRQLDA